MLNTLEIELAYEFNYVIYYIKIMNSIKNKKDLKETINEIRNFAYSYLEKYSPSKQQLTTYLFKKLIRKKQNITS